MDSTSGKKVKAHSFFANALSLLTLFPFIPNNAVAG